MGLRCFVFVAAMGVASLAVGLAHAGDASGCGGGTSVYHVTPPNGVEYPANAAILISGIDLVSPGDLVATVDGAPAALVPAPLPATPSWFGLLVEPEPTPGETVRIQGDLCLGMCGVDLTFTAGAPDLSPPTPLTTISFDLLVHTGIETADCPGGGRRAYFRLDIEDDASKDPLTIDGLVQVELFDLGFTNKLGEATSPRAFPGVAFDPDIVPGGEVCLRATATDAAGNVAGPAAAACKPCNYRKETYDRHPVVWNANDVYPGGPCDVGQKTTTSAGGGSPVSESGQREAGCSFGVPASSGSPGAIGVGFILWLLHRRRQRAATTEAWESSVYG